MRIGVYVCHCGGNISDVVDVGRIVAATKEQRDVILTRDVEHMCSEEGRGHILEDVKGRNLDRIVVAACSPLFHEKTFMAALEKAGLNRYLLEMANIREQCSWCHPSDAEATTKAMDLVRMAICRSRLDTPLEKRTVSIQKRVLVIGGGIAGIQTALDLGDAGFEVCLMEKNPSIGGKMAMLSKTFPTEDCATCIIGPKLGDVDEHPRIRLLTCCEIDDVKGYLGHFEVTIRKNPKYIVDQKCVSCGICAEKCPIEVPDEFNLGLSKRKAVYMYSNIAVPRKYIIDKDSCLRIRKGGNTCGICQRSCEQKAIDFDQKPEYVKSEFDTIIVATGYDLFDAAEKTVYGYGKYSNVLTALELERIIATGTSGPPLWPVGKRVAFIQCVGSRDEQVGRENCSRICCMYSTKLAQLLKRIDPARDVYIFYTDLRAYGKGFEEYYKRAQQAGINYIRGRPAEITEDKETNKLTVTVEDTLSRQIVQSEFDTVVLSSGMIPAKTTDKILEMLKLAKSSDGFAQEAHPKFRPVDTLVEGVFLAGCVQGPKDIPDTVAQASAAAARAIRLMNKGVFDIEPIVAFVHKESCNGCGSCIAACPSHAILIENGIAMVNDTLCKGCGMCAAACSSEALDLHYYTHDQMKAQIQAALESKKPDEVRVLIFADNTCTYRLADNLGFSRFPYPTQTRIIRVPSGSRVTPKLILFALKAGADGIFIGECDRRASPYQGSVDAIRKNVSIVNEILGGVGICEEHVRFSELLTTLQTEFYRNVANLVDVCEGTKSTFQQKIMQLPAIDKLSFGEHVT